MQELGKRLSRDYAGPGPGAGGYPQGVFIFMADLVRALEFPVEVDFVRLRSYGGSTESSREVEITKDVELSLQDRHVLIIEDIVDTASP